MCSSDLSSSAGTDTDLVIHHKLASLNSFTVDAPDGTNRFSVKLHLGLGKEPWTFSAPDGTEAAVMVRPPMHAHPTFTLDRPGRATVTIRKANFAPMRESWRIEGTEIGDLDVSGDLADHEFAIADATGTVVGRASRAWASIRETYVVRCSGIDPVTAAAAAIAFDVIEHQRAR